MNDPFMRYKETIAEGKAKVYEFIDRLVKPKVDTFSERIAELKADACEAEQYFKDDRYVRAKKFMDELRAVYSVMLERLTAQGNFDNIEVARIGAKIDLLDKLRNRPIDIIKELEIFNKKK
jgi:hypothetical protein